MPDLFNGTIGCFVHDNYILNIQGAGRTRQKAMERLKATEFSIRDDMTGLEWMGDRWEFVHISSGLFIIHRRYVRKDQATFYRMNKDGSKEML